jgi:predicted  nucleic acid-binding Zn-ribbon protein
MADVHKGLDNIEQLTLRLVERYEQARSENESLRVQLKKLNDELTESRARVELLNEELKSSKIARAVAISSEDNELAKAKIATLVREIDRCIALLNE